MDSRWYLAGKHQLVDRNSCINYNYNRVLDTTATVKQLLQREQYNDLTLRNALGGIKHTQFVVE